MNDKSEPPVDTWMGKSMGAWDGNALVVTTIGQNENSWLDRAGNFHSNRLEGDRAFHASRCRPHPLQATLEDPKTYSRPWTIEMPLYRLIDQNAELLEHKCVPFADKLL